MQLFFSFFLLSFLFSLSFFPSFSLLLLLPVLTQTTPTLSHMAGISYLSLVSLTFQATLQTLCVCLFGFFSAKFGLLPPAAQRYISQLNVQVFTPCLIFTKLASSLSLQALVDISVIPVFFAFSTIVTYSCSKLTSRMFGFNKRESNFVTAMGVFGNSNSLPVSLTVALAYVLPGLEWDDLPNDNADDIASRGILYLLIFQQLGQVLRWSWGYNTLLAKPTLAQLLEEECEAIEGFSDEEENDVNNEQPTKSDVVIKGKSVSSAPFNTSDTDSLLGTKHPDYSTTATRVNSNLSSSSPSNSSSTSTLSTSIVIANSQSRSVSDSTAVATPLPHARALYRIETLPYLGRIIHPVVNAYLWWISVMNPPLWAMLISISVGATPALKHQFFFADGFLQHTVTGAIRQLGQIAIPLILVVLGSNLAPDDSSAPPSKHYNKLILGSLMSRIFLPSVIILPTIALCVKFIKVSIFDDPIFLLVAFVLTIAPPAIQLSQICQLNKVFEKEMAGVLFWGYVVVTLPSTIFIVVLSIKVLDWVK